MVRYIYSKLQYFESTKKPDRLRPHAHLDPAAGVGVVVDHRRRAGPPAEQKQVETGGFQVPVRGEGWQGRGGLVPGEQRPCEGSWTLLYTRGRRGAVGVLVWKHVMLTHVTTTSNLPNWLKFETQH